MQNDEWRFNRIVVGVDGSSGANRAINWAINLARRTSAEIVAVHVGQPIPSEAAGYGFMTPVPSAGWQDELRGVFEEHWCRPLRQSAVPFRSVFEEGPPGPRLLEIADREAAALIVTGSRGLGPVREVILGSVSHYLIQHADIPVVVVPPNRLARQVAVKPLLAMEIAPSAVPT
jgi:nucleotide-binding universal stress UspA family protein